MSECKQYAHDYLAWYGWKPMLVHSTRWTGDGRAVCSCEKGPNCESSGKHPLLPRWTTEVAESAADIEALWEEYPHANVGIVTGRRSGIWVLDVDVDKGGMESYRKLFTPPPGTGFRVIDPPRVHKTGGGGFHNIYQLPPGILVRSRSLKALGYPGIDVRGEGGMIVAPPSVSAKGAYRVEPHDPNDRAGYAQPWLMDLLAEPADAPNAPTGGVGGPVAAGEPVDRDRLPARLQHVLAEIPDYGERSEPFYRLVCLCREAGLTEGQTVTLLTEWCDATVPPLYPGRVAQETRRAWDKHRRATEAYTLTPPPAVTGGPPLAVDAAVIEHPRSVDVAAVDQKAMFPLAEWVELWETIDDAPEWLWEPFVERGGSLAVYAKPGAGKSLFVLEGAACLASGRIAPGATQTRRPILVGYVDRENPIKTVVKRLRSMGFKPGDLTNLRYYPFPSVPALDTPYGGEKFCEEMLARGNELVILDTTSKYIEGDEDKAATINALDRYTIQPLTREGIGVIRIDHSGKDPTRGQRGSSAKEAIGDAAYFLSVEGDVVTMTATKRRAEECPEEIMFERRRAPTRHVVLDPATRVRLTADAAEAERSERVEELLEVMLDHGIRNEWKGKRRAEQQLRAVLAETGAKLSHDIFEQAYLKLATRQTLSDEDG